MFPQHKSQMFDSVFSCLRNFWSIYDKNVEFVGCETPLQGVEAFLFQKNLFQWKMERLQPYNIKQTLGWAKQTFSINLN